MDESVIDASALALGFDRWDRREPLDGGQGRTCVVRKHRRSYVLKSYEASGWGARGIRERAALTALDGAAGAPRVLAEGDDPPYVVMTHLEGTGSLADSLLGADPRRAGDHLLRWAEALAALHTAGTPGTRAAFRTALAERSPDLSPHALPGDFEAAADRYVVLLEELGLPAHDAALDELRALPSRLDDPHHEVLSPADTCPDNNLLGAGSMRLIDFEHAELRHAAWDVAYLRAPWPSCWCAWRLPDQVAEAALRRYCDARGDRVAPDGFLDDVELATLGWRILTPAWFIRGALDTDDRDLAPRRPSRRAFVLHRLAQVRDGDGPAALLALADDLHTGLSKRWGTVELDLAPAFRTGST